MNKDLLTQIKVVQHDKGIEETRIHQIIEDAHALLYLILHNDNLIDPKGYFNPRTGAISVTCMKEVIPDETEILYPNNEIHYSDAKEIDDKIAYPSDENPVEIEVVLDEVPMNDIPRSAKQKVDQFILDQINRAKREAVNEMLQSRVGELISGKIKPLKGGRNYNVVIGKMEVLLPMTQIPKGERFREGDRVQGVLVKEEREDDKTEIVVSRTSEFFPKMLITQEVHEIDDEMGAIKIERIVREPGLRTKVAVSSSDQKIDPVGTVIGAGGARIKNVNSEMNREPIDVIEWSDDLFELLERMLKNFSYEKIKVDASGENIMIIVPDDTETLKAYSSILGRAGSNIRLMGKMLGENINLTVQKLSTYKENMNEQRRMLLHSNFDALKKPLSLPENRKLVIQTLENNGVKTLRQFLEISMDENAEIEGLTQDLIEEILDQVIEEHLSEIE